jgi:HEAT repeat protein
MGELPATPSHPSAQPGSASGTGWLGGKGVPGATSGTTRTPASARTGSRRGDSEGLDRWEIWWGLHQDAYLVRHDRPKTGSIASPVGKYDRRDTIPVSSATLTEVQNAILPALLEGSHADDAAIADTSMVAIGKILVADQVDFVWSDVQAGLRSPFGRAQEAAMLAIGMLGHPRGVALLSDICRDRVNGRMLLQADDSVPIHERAIAAVALGLLGDRGGIETLLELVKSGPANRVDLQSCAVVALGLFKVEQETIMRHLLGFLDDPDLDRVVRCHAATAIAMLGPAGREAVPKLLQLLTSSKSDTDMVRSCVIALGKLASIGEEDVVAALKAVALESKDSQTRFLAHIALGEIAQSEVVNEGSAAGKGQGAILDFLLQQVAQTKSTLARSWAALALAIGARTAPSREILAIPALRRALADARDPSYKAALAIALGIVGATDARDTLLREFLNSGDATYKGYVGLALGMLNDGEAASPMLAMIRRKGVDPDARLNLVRALHLMNDQSVVDVLIDELGRVSSLSEASMLIMGLGLLHDSTAIAPLRDILRDPKRETGVRSVAAIALGCVAARTPSTMRSRLAIGLNYRALTRSLRELIDVF